MRLLPTFALLGLCACTAPSPSVDAGEPQEVDAGVMVTLAGVATPEGASVQWSQSAGPAVELEGHGALEATFTAPAVADDTVFAFVLEQRQRGATVAEDDTWVLVHEVDDLYAAPGVDAGDDSSVDEGASVTLAGAVTEGDAPIDSTLWSQVGGPSVELSDPTALEPTFVAPDTKDPLALGFRLEATDAAGVTGADETVISVRPVNAPPTVDAGDDQTVDEGDEVTLSGTAEDADGTVEALTWVQTSGPAVALSDATDAAPTFTAPATAAGLSLAFRLEATDDEGGTGLDDVTVTVDTTNTAPTAEAGADQDTDEGAQVTLSGTATDDDGQVTATAWSQFRGPAVTFGDPTALETSFTAPTTTEPLVLGFRLEVVDDDGAIDDDAVLVTVHPLNDPPVASAGPTETIQEGAKTTLQGSASDPDGSVARTLWREIGSDLVVFADATDPQTEITAGAVAFSTPVTLELEVEDDEGALDTDRTTLTIAPEEPVNRPPVVSAGVDQAVASGSEVTLSGAASDPDGTIASTTWSQVAGPSVEIADPGALDTSLSAPTVDCAVLLVFELEATDDQGATTSDRVSVVVDGQDAEAVPVGGVLDLESDDGGLITEGSLWEWGVPTSGPPTAFTDTRVWATDLDGEYPFHAFEVLCLPPLDLDGAVDPVLSFRAYLRIASGDALLVEGLDPETGWVPLTDATPALSRTVDGRPSWGSTSPTDPWWLTALHLPDWLGDEARLRFVFTSDGHARDQGAYLDDLRIDEAGDDPDADGLAGIFDEWESYGTDPFLPDSDGDGVVDGDEIDAGTNPTNPADWPDRPSLAPGVFLDFEADDGGLVPDTATWAYGTPTTGPGAAHSGTQVWATRLDSDYGAHERAHLYLPPLDLSDTTSPTLAARLWLDGHNGDGLSVEVLDPDTWEWKSLAPDTPAYEQTDALGRPAWRDLRYRSEYLPVALSLAEHTRDRVFLRIVLRTSKAWHDPGAYLDDLAVFDESADPDSDGISGILAELNAGTDPFVADTDGDGSSDGDEVQAGTNPLDPADAPDRAALEPGDYLDFEDGPQGVATTGTDWQHGTIASGPQPDWVEGRGWSGTQGWATNLSGDYWADADEHLYLPPIDLADSPDATLGFRLWLQGHNGDGLSVERRTTEGEWAALQPAVPIYDATNAWGQDAWRYQTGYRDYVWVAFSLAAFEGEEVHLRLAWRTSAGWQRTGAYVDDLSVDLESADPDGDGIDGVFDEYLDYGTDPYLPDTDADGATDGEEVQAGTDPLDPAWYPEGPELLPGDVLDFEDGPGGLASTHSGWEHGVFASGPDATSGSQGWATDLDGEYGLDWREYLHLPPITLAADEVATLRFRLWMAQHNGDGVSVERWTGSSWATLHPETPAYDGTDTLGRPAWQYQQTAEGDPVDVAFSLADYSGQSVRLRLAFRSDGFGTDLGAYIDDLSVELDP